MFKHAFHGGPAVEVFSTSGTNPLEKWKLTGNPQKIFDKQIKGYIYNLDGQTKIQVPKDDKEFLGLIQPFLVFQIFIPLGKNIHIEVGITDSLKTKRRLIFHTGAKEIVANPLHARIPITCFKRNAWVNLSIDIFAFAHYCFKGVNIRSIDLILVTASCKVRKIFTMKSPIYDDQEQDDPELQALISELMSDELRENMQFDYAPKGFEFPQGFAHFNQLIFPQRLRLDRQQDEAQPSQVQTSGLKQKVQLAFGQRVAGNPPAQQQNQNIQQQQMPQKQQQQQPLGKAQKHNNLNQDLSESENFYSPLPVTQDDFNKGPQGQKQGQQQLGINGANLRQIPQTTKNQNSNEKINKVKQQQNNGGNINTKYEMYSKEELKENSHYLHLQDSPEREEQDYEDENDDDNQKIDIGETNLLDDQGLQQNENNPWGFGLGRKEQDKFKQQQIKKQVRENQQPQHPLQSDRGTHKKNVEQKTENNVTESDHFYSYEMQKNSTGHNEDISSNDDHLVKSLRKIEQQKEKIDQIQSKYTKPQVRFFDDEEEEEDDNYFKKQDSPRNIQQTKKPFIVGQTKNNQKRFTKLRLKQDDNKEQEQKLSNYKGFQINQWEGDDLNKEELDCSIEEAIERNNENLQNFQSYREPINRESIDNKNPMFIEIEFNNEENELQDQNAKSQISDKNNLIQKDVIYYNQLESSRKEERRPFSPPFKVDQQQNFDQQEVKQQEPFSLGTGYEYDNNEDYIEQELADENENNDPNQIKSLQNEFQKKLELVKVQKASFLRDSLEELPTIKTLNQGNGSPPSKATVENEDGEVLDVVYDPVFKCYYDPQTNSYYNLKQ